MNEPLRITIREHGGRSHQIGNGPGGDGKRGNAFRYNEPEVHPHGDVVVHVQDGKPVTALGRKLLGRLDCGGLIG